MQKKGLELSLTVLVLIIITIIIFIGGIAMVWKFFAEAEEIKGGIEKSTQEQIEALLREGNEIVAIPINTKHVQIGKDAMFGLGIRNILGRQNFFIRLDFAGIYDKKGKTLEVGQDEFHLEQEWLGNFQDQGPIDIDKNTYEVVPIRIRAANTISAGQNTPKGAIVVFNVCVHAGNPVPECVLGDPSIYDKIHQVFIETK